MVGKPNNFSSGIKNGCIVPESYIEIWADALNTTVDYLTGESEIKEKRAEPVQSKERLSPARKSLIDSVENLSDEDIYLLIEIIENAKKLIH